MAVALREVQLEGVGVGKQGEGHRQGTQLTARTCASSASAESLSASVIVPAPTLRSNCENSWKLMLQVLWSA